MTGVCHISVYFGKERFLLYSGVNSSNMKGFTFTIFAFILYKNEKHNKKKVDIPIKFHCLDRSLCCSNERSSLFSLSPPQSNNLNFIFSQFPLHHYTLRNCNKSRPNKVRGQSEVECRAIQLTKKLPVRMNNTQKNHHRSNCVLDNCCIPFAGKAASLDWVKHTFQCGESCDCVEAIVYLHAHTHTHSNFNFNCSGFTLKSFFFFKE